jgi:serine/threonine protein kinase
MSDTDAYAATATSGRDSGPIAPPKQLGRYELIRQLGAGAMGVVMEAHDSELDRKVALKLLRKGRSDDAKARLLREARAMAKLPSDHVVTVHDVGTIDGQDYVAMELVAGGTLAGWLRDASPSHTAIVAAFVQAGRGLAAAHAEGIVHRDFKPHNVLRHTSGAIKVTDFGLARPATRIDKPVPAGTADPMVTATGSLLGTPAYMAPEQWDGGEVGPAADQFAFCVSLWEALTGARPFSGNTLDELRDSTLRGPRTLDASKLPRRLRPIVLRGLSIAPADRWPSMTALLAALEPRRPRWIVPVLAAAALLVGSIALATRHPSAAGPDLSKIQRIANGNVQAPRETIHAIAHELHTRTSARFVPTFKDHKPYGVAVFALHAGTLLDAIGISNGDILIAVNGHATVNPVDLDAVDERANVLILTVSAQDVLRTIKVVGR